MSGSIEMEDGDQAGLYVLGAMNAEEMRAFKREAEREPSVARAIEQWEVRLAPLALLAPPAEPPEALWTQLSARVARLSGEAAPQGEVYTVPVRRAKSRRRGEAARAASSGALQLWRGVAAAALAAAAGLGIALIKHQPEQLQVSMVMPAQAGVGGWLITLHPDGQIVAVAQGALTHTLKQDFELWALPDGSDRPQPLGLLLQTNTTTLKTGKLPRGKFALLVSLEPKGGSPSGIPTGPVMFAGDVQQP